MECLHIKLGVYGTLGLRVSFAPAQCSSPACAKSCASRSAGWRGTSPIYSKNFPHYCAIALNVLHCLRPWRVSLANVTRRWTVHMNEVSRK
ncbi:hypothetical protein EVAR_56275_1 [Eumeta japonica]|uniref:Uncharacterized protein n=1 Tax=Eumeta variegata TaxID=151549 RepID=A0A4C1YJ30_EUMVA|nr:hypothetical protein EVAR_56275_1 [Eumeta japonica]